MHLETMTIARYLAGEADPPERAEVERHLEECRSCRDELAAVAEVVDQGRPRRKRWFGAGAAVAAAAIAALLLLPPGGGDRGGEFLERDSGARPAVETIDRITVLAPRAGEDVALDELVFAWKPVGGEAVYRFTLTDAEGDLVWQTSLPDTLYRLDPRVDVLRDATYFWYVDALLPGGESATTGIHRFQTRP